MSRPPPSTDQRQIEPVWKAGPWRLTVTHASFDTEWLDSLFCRRMEPVELQMLISHCIYKIQSTCMEDNIKYYIHINSFNINEFFYYLYSPIISLTFHSLIVWELLY